MKVWLARLNKVSKGNVENSVIGVFNEELSASRVCEKEKIRLNNEHRGQNVMYVAYYNEVELYQTSKEYFDREMD